MRVTPHIWKEYEGDLFGFYRLIRLLMPVTTEEVITSMPDPKRVGHPIDWTYPTRVLWAMSLINKLIYRPLIECERWDYDMNPSLVLFYQLQSDLELHDPDLLLFPGLQSLVMDVSQYEGCSSTRKDIVREPADDVLISQDWEGGSSDDGHGELGYLISRDEGKERKDMIAKKADVDGFALSFVHAFRPAQTCLRLGPLRSHLDYQALQMQYIPGNLTCHDFDISEVYNLVPTLTNPNITWSFPSTSQTIEERNPELQKLLSTFRKVETLYLAKAPGQEDLMKEMVDKLFVEAKDRFIGTPYAETFITKWEWVESGKDGIPRCKACGGELTISSHQTKVADVLRRDFLI